MSIKNLAERIRTLRNDLGWSQSVLAEKAGLSDGAIKMIETGQRWPRPDTVDRIARALGIDQEMLFSKSAMDRRMEKLEHERQKHLMLKIDDAAELIVAYQKAEPLRRAVAMVVLTADLSYLDAFPDDADRVLIALKAL